MTTTHKIAAHYHFSGRLRPLSAKMYLAWEVAINEHRSNPDALVILGDSTQRIEDSSIDFNLDTISKATIVSEANAVRHKSFKMPTSTTASIAGKFDVAILSGMGPVAGAVLLVQIRVLMSTRSRQCVSCKTS